VTRNWGGAFARGVRWHVREDGPFPGSVYRGVVEGGLSAKLKPRCEGRRQRPRNRRFGLQHEEPGAVGSLRGGTIESMRSRALKRAQRAHPQAMIEAPSTASPAVPAKDLATREEAKFSPGAKRFGRARAAVIGAARHDRSTTVAPRSGLEGLSRWPFQDRGDIASIG